MMNWCFFYGSQLMICSDNAYFLFSRTILIINKTQVSIVIIPLKYPEPNRFYNLKYCWRKVIGNNVLRLVQTYCRCIDKELTLYFLVKLAMIWVIYTFSTPRHKSNGVDYTDSERSSVEDCVQKFGYFKVTSTLPFSICRLSCLARNGPLFAVELRNLLLNSLVMPQNGRCRHAENLIFKTGRDWIKLTAG
jgi:hypothetical protein